MRPRSRAALAGGVFVVAASAGIAYAHDGASSSDGAIDNAKITHNHHGQQHGEEEGHLVASKSPNISLVSTLALKNVEPGKIADVGVHKGYAYLAAWGGETCRYNGVHVVDIRDIANPKEVAFIQSKEGSAPGEGVQALSINTKFFKGDILVTNNEICKDKTGFGGLNIYNVTNAAHPTVLAEGFGDNTVPGQGKKAANEIHSVYAWQAGDKAYAVIVDNEEGADVDIVDISNPKKPVLIREIDVDEEFPQIVQDEPGNLVEVFHHDMIVKQIGGRQIMLISYWDGGYVKLDVTDPRNPTYVGDSDFPSPDTELLEQTGLVEAPEGNAHQAEFTADNRYVLAADEDFTPVIAKATTDDNPTVVSAGQGSSTPGLAHLQQITGPTKMVGRACIGDEAVPPGDGTQFAVVTRGLCTFTEKITNVEAAGGYIGAIIVNREGDDGCGPFGMTVSGGIPTFSVDRSIGYGLFDVGGFDLAACLGGTASLLPDVPVGAVGDTVTMTGYFDGWGYVRLYDNGAGKLTQLDTYAIPEAMDPGKARGFGDLSVHEIATSAVDPSLAYISYYAGGLRVVDVSTGAIREVGHYIADGGNNFWGVQTFIGADGKEYVAMSDRDMGLFIFRYQP